MSGGYLSDSPYLPTFIGELAPSWLDRVALTHAIHPPRLHARQAYRHCDLGCGPGVTSNILAATSPGGEFVGIDALDNHIADAESLACDAGIGNVGFHCLRFHEALGQPFQPFDYIVAHGVYSWVDHSSREQLLTFAGRHLKPGGLFYLSYNALPGWNQWVPAQKLLLDVVEKSSADPATRFAEAVALIHAMHQAGARHFLGNPLVERFLQRVETMPSSYLLHEYLSSAWHASYSSDLISELDKYGLSFIGTAIQREQRTEFVFSRCQRSLLESEPDRARRELLKDYCLDTPFRMDVFAKSPRQMDEQAAFQAKARQSYALNPLADSQMLRLQTPAGMLKFDNPAAHELLHGLCAGPSTPSRIVDAGRGHDSTLGDLVNTADALWAADIIRPVDPEWPECTLDALDQALLSRYGELPLKAVPHGTALPAKAKE